MPDRLEVNEDLGIIEVFSGGPVTQDDIADSLAKAQQIRETKRIDKILVDTTTQETMPDTVAIFDFFSGFPREFRVAMLARKSQKTEKDLAFAETVAVNRGLRVRLFYDREEALRWLKG